MIYFAKPGLMEDWYKEFPIPMLYVLYVHLTIVRHTLRRQNHLLDREMLHKDYVQKGPVVRE
jgi:hypothetical protein